MWGDGTAAGSKIPPGIVCNQLVAVLDWVPTFIQLVGGTIAKDQHMNSTSILSLLTSREPDSIPPVRTWHIHRGDVYDSRIAVRMDDEAGKWVLIQPTKKRPMEFYNLATDLAQKSNLFEGFKTLADLPADHLHFARVTHLGHLARRARSPRLPALHPGGSFLTRLPRNRTLNSPSRLGLAHSAPAAAFAAPELPEPAVVPTGSVRYLLLLGRSERRHT